MSSLDLLDRLLEHDAWTTQRVLELAQALDDAQLDAEFDIGHRTWRATARHMVGNIEVWTDLMAERPVRAMPAGTQTLSVLQARFAAAYRDFAAVARAARDAGRLNALYLDVLDQPPRAKTLGGTILHVVTHNHMHRAELLHMLQRLGVNDLIEGDMLSWEAQTHA